MYPELIHIGPVSVHSYGVMLALAVLAGILVARREAARHGYDPDGVLEMSVYLIVAGLFGSRLLYVLLEWRHFAGDPLAVLRVWEPGLSYYGAIGAGALAAVWFARRRGWTFPRLGDVLALAVAAGYPIARVGCYLNGCCYGKPATVPWAVAFPFDGVPRHPTQLYSLGFGLLIFGILWWRRRAAVPPGYLMWLYFLLYAGYRFILDFWRVAPPGVGGLTLTQVAALPIMLGAAAALVYLGRRAAP
ncbi:MAG: Prolipoprotein diacylglyceryl transferase [Clostridia bacterium 62_21]|nr:MAG: Prolipoprotein diacylglyceryl transferase [Clostridia bacterium 62_21]